MRALKELGDFPHAKLKYFLVFAYHQYFPMLLHHALQLYKNVLGDLSIVVIAPYSQSSYVYLTNVSCNVR